MSSLESCQLDHAGGPVRIVQITDTHLCAEPGGKLLSMDTDFSLQQVLAAVKRERKHIDLVLATGDLADSGNINAYQRLQDYLETLSPHHFWLVGNHDDHATMAQAVRAAGRMVRCIYVGRWQILMLNSQIPGQVGGHLGEQELAALKHYLEAGEAQNLYTLVCLHHHPISINCAWLDEQRVSDGEAFLDLLASFSSVRGVLWGHIHQQIDRSYDSLRLMASPSTCVQFAPNSVDFKADDLPPGYRWLDLAGDGTIETGVSRVEGIEFEVDLESDGYL